MAFLSGLLWVGSRLLRHLVISKRPPRDLCLKCGAIFNREE